MAIIVHYPEDGWDKVSDPTTVCGRWMDINDTVQLIVEILEEEDPDERNAIPEHVWGEVTPVVGPDIVHELGLEPCDTCDPRWDVYAGRAGMY